MKWSALLLIAGLAGVVGGFTGLMTDKTDSKIAARVDRLEQDNALQQKIITELGDKVAAHLNK